MAKAKDLQEKKKKHLRRPHKLLPKKPKRASNGFGAFIKEYFATLKDSKDRNRNSIRVAARRWKALSKNEQARYNNLVMADRNRYLTEMEEWKRQRSFLKRPANTYALFVKEIWQRERNNKKAPTIKKIGKMAGKEWKKLSKEDKDELKRKVEKAKRNYAVSVQDFEAGLWVNLERQLYTEEDYVSLMDELNSVLEEEGWSDFEWDEEDEDEEME